MTTARPLTPLTESVPVNTADVSEKALIGKLLSLGAKASDAFEQVKDIKASDFALETHRLIWFAFQALAAENKPLSFTMIQDRLNKPMKGTDTTALSRVTVAYMQALITEHRHHNLLDAAACVRERAASANGVKVANAIVKDMTTLSPALAFQSAMERLTVFGTQLQALDGHAGVSMADGLQSAVETIKAKQAAYLAGERPGALMATGYRELDTLLDGGLWRSELTVLMADPSVGKTALSLCIALNGMAQGMRVLYIPLEMTPAKMIVRALSVLSGVSASAIKTGRIGDDQIERVVEVSRRFDESRESHQFHFLTLDAMPNINAVSVKLHQYMAMHGADLIVIDQISPEALSPVKPGIPLPEWISNAAAVARGWGMKYNIPVLAPAQMAKGREQRTDSEPTLKDGAGSYGIARTADNVFSMSRDDTPAVSGIERVKVKLLKQREGARGECVLDFVTYLTKFANEGEGLR